MTRPGILLLLALAVAGGGCGSAANEGAAALPSGVPAQDFTGVWTGEYTLTECSGLRHCVPLIGARYAFALRLEQRGSSVQGVFVTRGDAVDVAGVVTKNGDLVVSGTQPGPLAGSETQVEELAVRHDDLQGLAGRLRVRSITAQSDPWAGPVVLLAGDVTTARFAPLDNPAQVEGTWGGWFVVRGCEFSGWIACWPYERDDIRPLELALTQSGTVVSGQLTSAGTRMPVHGTYAGGALTLTGEVVAPVSGGQSVTRLLAWSAARTRVGRMTGTLRVLEEYRIDGGRVLSSTYDAELVSVVLDPPR